jgi:pilus assembly protein CpaB
LTADNVREIPWAAGNIPATAFLSKKALFKDGRRIALAAIEPDEAILNSRITGPGQRATLSTSIDQDMRAIAVRVDDVRGVAGFIKPNDRVDVLHIRSEAGSQGRKESSDLLLQDVKVIAVDQISAEEKDKPLVAKAVTLEVTPQQAQKISLASNIGHLSLILRKAGDSGIVANSTITESDLREGETGANRGAPAKAETVGQAPAPMPLDATVTIIRDLESQDYKVVKEVR